MSRELSEELVKSPAFRWIPGMLAVVEEFPPLRLVEEAMPFVWWGQSGSTAYEHAHSLQGDVVPDLDDPATVGCLLALLDEATGGCWRVVETPVDGKIWRQVEFYAPPEACAVMGATPGAALAHALIALGGEG